MRGNVLRLVLILSSVAPGFKIELFCTPLAELLSLN